MLLASHPLAGLLSMWGNDPAWLAMDASARGFHTQLLLMSMRQKPEGSLPDDDALWRRWLGLPVDWTAAKGGRDRNAGQAPDDIKKTLQRFFDDPGRKGAGISEGMLLGLQASWDPSMDQRGLLARGSYEAWIDHLWTTRWKPMVLASWIKVDATLIAQQPSLKGHEGRWWNSTAAVLSGLSAPVSTFAAQAPTPVQTLINKPKRAGKKKKIEEDLPSPLTLDGTLGAGDVGTFGVLWVGGGTDGWRDTTKVMRLWRAPLTQSRRRSLWDVGIACLAVDMAEGKQARTFLGKLISQHGEEKVGKAVADLATRALPPADGYSFLTAMLRRANEGSEAEQKARLQRSRVAL